MFLLASFLGIFTSSFDAAAPSTAVAAVEQKQPTEWIAPADPTWRIPKKGARVYLIGDFLYWSATSNAVLQGFKIEDSSHVKIKPFDIAYKPGFRVGLGYRLPHDSWEAAAYVTQLRTTNHLQQTTHGDASIETNFGNLTEDSENFDSQKGHWHLKYTLLDGELSRCVAASKALIISPFIGARGAWIHQKEHLTFSGSNVLNVDAHSHYRAGGLRLGTDLHFYFMKYVCLFGKAAASLIWGCFEEETRIEMDDDTLFLAKAKPKQLAGDIALRAGAKGTLPLYQRQAFLTLGLTYDMALWFFDNQFLNVFQASDALQTQMQQGNLTLQGISVTVRLDF